MKQLPLDATDEMIITALKEFLGLSVEERESEAYHFHMVKGDFENGDDTPRRLFHGR